MYKAGLLVLLLFNFYLCMAQDKWKLRTEEDGIKIYTSPVLNSAIKAIKAECMLNATPSQLVAVITDLKHCKDWVYHSKSNILVKVVSPSELYYYSEVVVPWPAQNRDFIAHIMVSQNSQTKVVTVDAPCVADMVPRRQKIVRITHSVGKWTITPVKKNLIRVEYELEVDPGGTVPVWLVNLFATQGPMETFEKLKVQVQTPLYKNQHFSFIND